MYLIDTNVVSEARKRGRANSGVIRFFQDAAAKAIPLYLSAISVGELHRGVDLVRHRGDIAQAGLLEAWLGGILVDFTSNILSFDADAAQIWGHLRAPAPAQELDKQIAAIALIYDLTLVTRNVANFAGTGVRLQNPFLPASA